MKNIFTLCVVCLAALTHGAFAQTKASLAIMHIETNGIKTDSLVVNGLVNIEVEKTGRYTVADRHDIAYALNKSDIELRTCRSRECLADAGRVVKVDHVLTGSVTGYPNKVVVSLRLIRTNDGAVEASQVQEFLHLPSNIQEMIHVTVAQLFGMPVSTELVKSLTNRENYENALNNPDENTSI